MFGVQLSDYEAASKRMEAIAARFPRGGQARKLLQSIQGKMYGIIYSLNKVSKYNKDNKKFEYFRAEQRDWTPTTAPHNSGETGFVAVQRKWTQNDGGTKEDTEMQTAMPVAGRGSSLKSAKATSSAPKPTKATTQAPNFTIVSSPALMESKTIMKGTTVKLTQAQKLNDDTVIPANSVVTVSDNALKAVTPSGQTIIKNSRLLEGPKQLIDKLWIGNVNYRVNTNSTQRIAAFTEHKEREIAKYLETRGYIVEKNFDEGVVGKGRQSDAFVNGKKTEFKTLETNSANSMKNLVNDSIRGTGQAREIVIDTRNLNIKESDARNRAYKAIGISRGKLDGLTIIGENYFFRVVPKK